jgi:hypothetical protein
VAITAQRARVFGLGDYAAIKWPLGLLMGAKKVFFKQKMRYALVV